MTISIHQPNFFPYYPFFQKMQQSDVFVIMSHCQFEKGGYQNRFNIGEDWFTMSTGHGLEAINLKEYITPILDFNDIKKALPKYSQILNQFDFCAHDNLFMMNACVITKLAQNLGIRTKIVHDYPTVLTGTARLVHLCQNYGASKYLSGISGKKYLDISLFEKAGIEVIFQNEETMIKKPILEVLHEKL